MLFPSPTLGGVHNPGTPVFVGRKTTQLLPLSYPQALGPYQAAETATLVPCCIAAHPCDAMTIGCCGIGALVWMPSTRIVNKWKSCLMGPGP